MKKTNSAPTKISKRIKLLVRRETIVFLTHAQLQGAAGGSGDNCTSFEPICRKITITIP